MQTTKEACSLHEHALEHHRYVFIPFTTPMQEWRPSMLEKEGDCSLQESFMPKKRKSKENTAVTDNYPSKANEVPSKPADLSRVSSAAQA